MKIINFCSLSIEYRENNGKFKINKNKYLTIDRGK